MSFQFFPFVFTPIQAEVMDQTHNISIRTVSTEAAEQKTKNKYILFDCLNIGINVISVEWE